MSRSPYTSTLCTWGRATPKHFSSPTDLLGSCECSMTPTLSFPFPKMGSSSFFTLRALFSHNCPKVIFDWALVSADTISYFLDYSCKLSRRLGLVSSFCLILFIPALLLRCFVFLFGNWSTFHGYLTYVTDKVCFCKRTPSLRICGFLTSLEYLWAAVRLC